MAHPPGFPRVTRIFWIYLLSLGILSILAAAYTTSTYGSGVGTDGAQQLSTADHLLSGDGLVDSTGTPFTKWPPLYPYLLAGLSQVSGLDTFKAGWLLNVLLFGVIVWLGGALLYDAFPDELLWAFIGSAVIASSSSVLSLAVNIGNDPLFIALTLAFLLASNRYLATGSPGSLLGMGLLACLASLQRLPGVTLVAAGAILILYKNRQHLLIGLRRALVFSALACLPFTLWLVFHNILENRTLFGIYLFAATLPLENIQISLEKILHWFFPYSLTGRIPPLLLMGIPALGLALASRKPDWERLGGRLVGTQVLPSLIFGGLYLVLLVFTANSVDTNYPFYDRYQLVILAPALILTFSILQELALARFTSPTAKPPASARNQSPDPQPALRSNLVRLAVLLVFTAWLAYPVYNLVKYATLSRSEGVITYNKYNTRTLRQSKVVRVLQGLGGESGQTLYSNYPAAAWFYTHRDALPSPRGQIVGDFHIDEVIRENQGWPWDHPGYLVWFLPNEYDHVLEPRVLAKFSELMPIYKGKDGEIYRVQAKLP